MFYNHLKIALRNLLKYKINTTLNVLGLAIGMAAAMITYLWIQHETSFDMFHSKRDQLHLVVCHSQFDGELKTNLITPQPLGPALLADYPEIVNMSRQSELQNVLMQAEDQRIKAKGYFVDSTFLEIFDFNLVAGNKALALGSPNHIAITKSTAERIFGKESALGKSIVIDTANTAVVTAVLADLPDNTRFREADYFMPWSAFEQRGRGNTHWGNFTISTYVELAPGVAATQVNEKVQHVLSDKTEGTQKAEVSLHALPDWWLYSKFEGGLKSGGRIDMVHVFVFITLFTLIISCINFTNLSTARSERRAKEVGVRKVMGAVRRNLVGQFLLESILIAFCSGLIALGLVWLFLPAFGNLFDRNIILQLDSFVFWIAFFGFIVLTGILAGIYPALFLSAARPLRILKGSTNPMRHAINPRRILVAFQFVVAISFVIATLIIRQQLHYAEQRDNGFEQQNLIYINEEGNMANASTLIRKELIDADIALSITRTSSPLTESWSSSWGFEWAGQDKEKHINFDWLCADDQIVQTAGLKLVAGRDFDLNKFPTDSLGMIINESAARALGFEDQIGQTIRQVGADWHVIGVVEDFILGSPFDALPPMIISGAMGWFNVMHIKFRPELSTKEALQRTEAILKKYNPDYPFEYQFVDAAYAEKFKETQRYSLLSGVMTGITILISCLGLIALAAYMAENRTKEIGVRKVLGASVWGIIQLLISEFLFLILLACLIAFPIAYWLMDHYFLSLYTYRTTIGWPIFLGTGIGIFLLALFTVSSQAIRAATANPITSLRDE